MSSISLATGHRGITLRQAALTAGFGVLAMVAVGPFAELVIYPRLVIAGDIESTARNIVAHAGLFKTALLCYFIMFSCDILVAWALYVLLIPVNRSLALLAGWLRLVYAVISLMGLSKMVIAYRMLHAPDYEALFGSDQLHAQVRLLLASYQYIWELGIFFFGAYLGLLGYLVFRSGYIPRVLGILLGISGTLWLIYALKPYLYPTLGLDLLAISSIGELIFVLWLVVRGWRIPEPEAAA